MKLQPVKQILLTFLLLSSYLSQAEPLTFGSGADMSKEIKISSLLANSADYENKLTTISGTIITVCKKRGCWMELAADKQYQTLTIKVPDGQMVFPISAIGKTAYATGTLSEKQLNIEKTKEYLAYKAQESQATFDAKNITKGMTLYRFTPVGVTIID